MTIGRFAFAMALGTLGAGIAAAPALAQAQDRSRQATATLPESNEAILLSGRIDDALESGDYRLALELLEQLRTHSGELFAPAASRSLVPIWRQVFRLQRQLPPAALAMYRQLHDAEAAAKFAAAANPPNLDRLRAVFRTYPLTGCWPEAGRRLAARLIDEGAYSEATEVLRELVDAGDDPSPEIVVRLAIALAAGGARVAAHATLDDLLRGGIAAGGQALHARIADVRAWIDARAGLPRNPAPPLRPAIGGPAAWSQPLTRGDDPPELDREVAESIEILRRMPLQEPLVAGDVLIVRGRGVIWAVDALTLIPRWQATEQRLEGYLATGVRVNNRMAQPEATISPDAELNLTNHLRHVIAVAGDTVYAIEGLTLFENDGDQFGRMPFGVDASAPRNELVARNLADGRIRWRTAAETTGPLATAAFQDRPLLLGGDLVAPFVRNSELRLAILDPASGALRREVQVVGPPTHFTREGGRVLLAADDATLFISTGNGVVAALHRGDYSWQWATVYPSTLVEHLGQQWWQPQAEPVESGVDRPIIADDLLLVAPVDSTDIFAIDRFDGRERWRLPRRDVLDVVGLAGDGLVLSGQGLSCVDLHDPIGKPLHWKSVPLEIVGRATISGDRVFVPTREGVVALDARTGKVVDAPRFVSSEVRAAASASESGAVLGANLVAGAGALFAVTPSKVVKLPDPGQTAALVRETGLPESDPRVAIPLAWCDALSGRLEAALARLEKLPAADQAGAAARDNLLAHVFLGLARSTDSRAARLDWLKRAADLTAGSEFSAQLALVIGNTLEEDGRWNEAAAHYIDMLKHEHGQLVADEADPYRRASSGVRAIGRLRRLVTDHPDAVAPALTEAVARCDPAEDALGLLEQLRCAVAGTGLEALVRLAMLEGRLPPELALERLPDPAQAGLPATVGRRALLARWEAHVGLDMLGDAGRDAERWRTEFKDVPLSAAEEQRQKEILERIDVETRKISAATGAPFEYGPSLGHRRWKIVRAELRIDDRDPLTAVRDWIPIRNYGEGQIQLIETLRNQFPWRQTDDGVGETGSTAAINDIDVAMRANIQMMANESRPRNWPIAIHGSLAAVPTRGGIVCTSLAPGRYGRKRAWTFSVPAWAGVPTGFENFLLATGDGVVVCPRPDRVELIGWTDGMVRWRRDFPGALIQRIDAAAGRIVVQLQDQQVFTFDAALGDRAARLPPEGTAAREIDVFGERVIVWTADGAQAYDATALQPVWQSDLRDVAQVLRVWNSDWIGVRGHGDDRWRFLHSADGKPAIAAAADGIEKLGDLRMAACDGGLLITVRGGDPDLRPSKLRISAFDATTGQQRWRTDAKTGSLPIMNPTQLCGHPKYIVLLSDAAPGGGDPANPNRRFLALQLIDKASGTVLEPIDITGTFEPQMNGLCDTNALVTPTRIVVQANGNLIAFGNPPNPKVEP